MNEETEQLRVGLNYSVESRQNYHSIPPLTQERVRSAIARACEKGDAGAVASRRANKKPGDVLRRALALSLNEFPPLVIEHALKVTNFNALTPMDKILEDSSLMHGLLTALEEAQKVVNGVTTTEICQGYIIARLAKTISTNAQNSAMEAKGPSRADLLYEDFHPFRPRQFEGDPEIKILEFEGFNRTVDEFYSSIEAQKISSRLSEREENAKRKLETARLDHKKRLGSLQEVQELNVRKAQAIEANLPKVQEAIAAVNGLLAQGMDWMDVARLIEMEQAKQNPVAEMIKLPLKLYENSVTLRLAETTFDDDYEYDEDKTDSDVSLSSGDEDSAEQPHKASESNGLFLAVDVDLALSPWSNARQYYDQKKSAAVKEQKTLQSSEKALKSTERKINTDLKKGLKQEKEVMRPRRKIFWFEKFTYFISSDGYLVIGGKEAPQNEILYTRYLKKGDVYIHADLHGAASMIVKNKAGMVNNPIPPSTLSQAGTLAVATSSAWESKAGMSAWWVNADQVSKTAPSGEYLAADAFMIRGQKNFLPPAQLLLGFGLFFRVSEESKLRHLKHRVQDGDGAKSDAIAQEFQGIDEHGEAQADDVEDTHDEEEQQPTSNNIHDDETDETPVVDPIESGSEGESERKDSGIESGQDNPLQRDQYSIVKIRPAAQDLETEDLEVHSRSGTSTDSENKHHATKLIEEDTTRQGRNAGAVEDRKRRLSAKERRLMSKSHAPTNANDPFNSKGSNTSTAPIVSHDSSSQHAPTIENQLIIRGKHGKRNKFKTKYADQDEEDRALAMRLLGSAAAQEKAADDAAAKVAKEQELLEQKERRRKQHEIAAMKGKELEEIRRLNFKDSIETLDDGEAEEMDNLDSFVGAPLPGDNILDVLVVCGPWPAIGARCRWKVKLQPGAMKKGKAVREILGKWMSVITDGEKKQRPNSGHIYECVMEEEKLREREAELIRAIREPEVVGIIPVGKVRIQMGPEVTAKGKGSAVRKGKRGGKGSKRQR